MFPGGFDCPWLLCFPLILSYINREKQLCDLPALFLMPNFDSDYSVMSLDHFICLHFLLGHYYLHLHTFCHSLHVWDIFFFLRSVVLFRLFMCVCCIFGSLSALPIIFFAVYFFVGKDHGLLHSFSPWHRWKRCVVQECRTSREGCECLLCWKM